MTKFTKGAWHVDWDYSAIFNEQCNFICDASSSADANLIATAPEMYEMLSAIADLVSRDVNGLEDEMLCKFDEIEVLLSKARGD